MLRQFASYTRTIEQPEWRHHILSLSLWISATEKKDIPYNASSIYFCLPWWGHALTAHCVMPTTHTHTTECNTPVVRTRQAANTNGWMVVWPLWLWRNKNILAIINAIIHHTFRWFIHATSRIHTSEGNKRRTETLWQSYSVARARRETIK